MKGHIINNKSIPTHKNHSSIIFHEFIPRAKPFVTHMASFASNYVSDQIEMSLTKVREVFVQYRHNTKILLPFLHRYHGLGAI